MNRSPLDTLRENAVTGLTRIRDHGRQLKEAQMYHFTDVEKNIIRKLRESYDFSVAEEGQVDRFLLERLIVQSQPVPISEVRKLARKVEGCIKEGLFSCKLEWNGEHAHILAEANRQGTTVQKLTEAMGSSTSGEHAGMDDKGMKGIGDDADKDEPKGQADKGTNQKSDHGQAPPGQGGYMDEDGNPVGEAQDRTPDHNAMVNKWNGDGKREGYNFVEATGYSLEQLCSMTEAQLVTALESAFTQNINEGQMVYDYVTEAKKMSYEKGHDYPNGKNGNGKEVMNGGGEDGKMGEGEVPDAFKKHMKPKGSDADGDGKTGEGKGKPDFAAMGKGKDEAKIVKRDADPRDAWMKNWPKPKGRGGGMGRASQAALMKKTGKIAKAQGLPEKGHDYPMGKDEKYEDMDYPMGKKDKEKDEAVAPDQAPKANMAPSPTNDSNTAATNARYKKGAKQNESLYDMGQRHAGERAMGENSYGNEGSGHVKDHKPQASTPGTGSATVNSSQPEEPGAVPDTPAYGKAKEEDPSSDPKNKGPAQAANEAFNAEATFEEAAAVVSAMLEDREIERGTDAWNEAYELGMEMYVQQRAEEFAAAN